MLEEIDRENRSEANRTTGFEKKKKYANLKKYRQLFVEEVKKTLLVKIGKFLFPNATDAMEFARSTLIFTTPLSAIQIM